MRKPKVISCSRDATLQQLHGSPVTVNIEAMRLRFVVHTAPRALLELMVIKDWALPMRHPSRTALMGETLSSIAVIHRSWKCQPACYDVPQTIENAESQPRE